jgi:hypothetical protein
MVKIMNPIGAVAAKQGGTLGKVMDPAQYAGSKSDAPAVKYLDPMNFIREEPDEEWETPSRPADTGQYSAKKGQALLVTPFGTVGTPTTNKSLMAKE